MMCSHLAILIKGAIFMAKRSTSQKEADQKYEAKRAGTRARYWTFIAYPDSAPINWLQVLKDEQISFVVSPIHDMDINEDGSSKKPHYHVLLLFDNNKTIKQAEEVSKLVNGTMPITVKDKSNLVRYFTHVDRPEKAQYSPVNIVTYGKSAVDLVDEAYAISDVERLGIINEIYEWISENEIHYYDTVVDFARINNLTWHREINNRKTGVASLIHKYILSKATKAKESKLAEADTEHNAWLDSLKQSKTTE